MPQNSLNEAAISNSALQLGSGMVDEWYTVGTHRLLLDTTLHGQASFTWLQGVGPQLVVDNSTGSWK